MLFIGTDINNYASIKYFLFLHMPGKYNHMVNNMAFNFPFLKRKVLVSVSAVPLLVFTWYQIGMKISGIAHHYNPLVDQVCEIK